jgi:hypothetical protein
MQGKSLPKTILASPEKSWQTLPLVPLVRVIGEFFLVHVEMLDLEALLALQRPPNRPIDGRFGSEDVVIQIGERSVDSIDPPMGLLPQLVRIGQAIEAHRIGLNTVPALGSGNVLHRIQPLLGLRNVFVPVTVPFRVRGIHQTRA